MIRLTVLISGLLLWSMLWAEDTPFEFTSPEQAARYQHLTKEIRCLVCQNQSLADSHAELAQDLRNELYQMILDGKRDSEIIDFLVTRYGDFVLYRPPVKGTTWLLWFAPFLLLTIAIAVIVFIARSRSVAAVPELSQAEREELAHLLAADERKQGEGE